MRVERFNPDKDYGTPARLSETLVSVQIDGIDTSVSDRRAGVP